jgi:hypothetical protein
MAPVIPQVSQAIPPDSTSADLISGSSGTRTTEVLIRDLDVSSSDNSITFTPPASYAFTDDTDSDTSDTTSTSNSNSNSDSDSSSDSNQSSGLSGPLKGAIAGSILGAVFLLLLLYCCYRRSPRAIEEHRRRKHRSSSSTIPKDPYPDPAPAQEEPAPEAEPAEPAPIVKKKKTVRIAPGSTPPPHFALHPHVRPPVKVKVRLYPDSEEAKGTFSSIERYTMDLGAGSHIRIKRGKSGTPIAFVSRPRDGSEVV